MAPTEPVSQGHFASAGKSQKQEEPKAPQRCVPKAIHPGKRSRPRPQEFPRSVYQHAEGDNGEAAHHNPVGAVPPDFSGVYDGKLVFKRLLWADPTAGDQERLVFGGASSAIGELLNRDGVLLGEVSVAASTALGTDAAGDTMGGASYLRSDSAGCSGWASASFSGLQSDTRSRTTRLFLRSEKRTQ